MEPEKKINTAYLERHGKKWRVSVPVPTTLRSVLGTRLKRVLDTESLEAANVLKRRVIEEFRAEIARAREAEVAGRDARRRTGEAMALGDELRAASTPREAKKISSGIRKRVEALKRDLEISKVSDADSKTSKYEAIAIGVKTPVDYHYTAFTKWLKKTNPYTAGYPKTLAPLFKALHRHQVDPWIENVDHAVVLLFMRELYPSENAFVINVMQTNITFRRVEFYWAWLVKFGYAKDNPFSSSIFYEDKIYGEDISFS